MTPVAGTHGSEAAATHVLQSGPPVLLAAGEGRGCSQGSLQTGPAATSEGPHDCRAPPPHLHKLRLRHGTCKCQAHQPPLRLKPLGRRVIEDGGEALFRGTCGCRHARLAQRARSVRRTARPGDQHARMPPMSAAWQPSAHCIRPAHQQTSGARTKPGPCLARTPAWPEHRRHL